MQEASTLKSLYDSLDDIMAKADMPKMLSALATMRSSVDSLVNVPEFVGVSDKVAMLETRVKELSVPKLADAIDRKQGLFCALTRRSSPRKLLHLVGCSITASGCLVAGGASPPAAQAGRWAGQVLQM